MSLYVHGAIYNKLRIIRQDLFIHLRVSEILQVEWWTRYGDHILLITVYIACYVFGTRQI